MHRAAKTSGFALSSAADSSVSGTSANGAWKPKLTSLYSAKSIDHHDPHLARQGNSPPGSTLPLDESKTNNAAAVSSPAAERPIQESDATSIPEEALQIDRTATSDTPSLPEAGAVLSPANQQGDPSWISQEEGQQENSRANGSKQPYASPASSPAPATFRVAAAGADSTPDIALAGALDKDGHLAERSSRPNSIAGALSSKRAQIFLLFIFGLAIFVFVISLAVIRRPAPTSVDFQSAHGWREENAQISHILVDDVRGQSKIQAEAERPKRSVINSTAPRRLYLEDCKAALRINPR
jgi:hypothetical protein